MEYQHSKLLSQSYVHLDAALPSQPSQVQLHSQLRGEGHVAQLCPGTARTVRNTGSATEIQQMPHTLWSQKVFLSPDLEFTTWAAWTSSERAQQEHAASKSLSWAFKQKHQTKGRKEGEKNLLLTVTTVGARFGDCKKSVQQSD